MSERKLKLFFVMGSLRMGGAERMMINLANRLCNRAGVTMITLSQGNDLEKELDPSLRFIPFGSVRVINSFLPFIRFLKKEKPDVIISTQIHVNILCMLAVIFSGVRIKVILREATTPGFHFDMNKGIRSSITRQLMKWLYPRADAVVVNATSAGKDMVDNHFAPQKKVSIIYNPVITENFRKKIQEKTVHPFFGQAPVFIGIGRLAKQKNFPLLIRAFDGVLKKTDARLIIVGEGNERENLSEIISALKLNDKVDMPGQLLNPYPLLCRADTFVLSSGYEGLPNALIEAIACGVQVISTDCPGGSREILLNGKLGELVPVNDAPALAEAMLKSLQKRIPPEELKRSASRFDAEEIASTYFSLVKKICNG